MTFSPLLGTADSLLEDLRKEIAGRKVVFVVGAGVSLLTTENATVASWKGLLHNGIQRIQDLGVCPPDAAERMRASIESGDLDQMLVAATFVAKKLGAPRGGEFRKWLRETIGQLPLKNSDTIQAIARTGCPILTTNYDGLIELVTHRPQATWMDPERWELVVRGDEDAVMHIHGSWEVPESVILGQDSYALIKGNKRIQEILRGAYLTKTFVYVGCGAGLSDPNFSQFLQWCEEILGGSEYRRYRLARASEVAELQESHPSAQRIKVISYGSEYQDLPKFLNKLCVDQTSHSEGRAHIAQLPPLPLLKGSAELATRIGALSSELVDHPLIGREEEVKRLRGFLELPSGFILVTGNAGHGKSALLAHWVTDESRRRRVLHHMFSFRSDLTRSVLEFYRSALVTLSEHWRRPLLRMPASEGEARDALFTLLEDIRLTGAAEALPLLLVVDGLDEAAPAERWDCPFFPKALPEGMHIVISVRLDASESPPAYLNEWLRQCDEQLFVGPLDRTGLESWMREVGGALGNVANDAAAVNALLEKTGGVPLHVAFLFEDFASTSDEHHFTKLVEQTPTGLVAYVDLQFRRLVESSVGKDQRWREFFGLLVAARAELDGGDINAILGLSVWDLHTLPVELSRWVARRDGSYAFRHEALKLVFARLNPWSEAKERLLAYSRNWRTNNSRYALRSLVWHLRDSGDRAAWMTTACDRDFIKRQGDAFPFEPLLPLQTIEDAMSEAIAKIDLKALSYLVLTHASWMPNPHRINPTECALTSPVLATQRIRLAGAIDPSTEPMWQMLVAWRCAIGGHYRDASSFLSQVATSKESSINVVYWTQILGAILPDLMKVDAVQTIKVAQSLLDTAELPKFLATVCPAAEAIERTRIWSESKKNHSDTGWTQLWRTMAARGDLQTVLTATRDLQPDKRRANALWEVALALLRLDRLEELEQCYVEIEANRGNDSSGIAWEKAKTAILAAIGSIRLKSGENDGVTELRRAEALAAGVSPLWSQAEAFAVIGLAWARAGKEAECFDAFNRGLKVVPASKPWLEADVIPTVARYLYEAHYHLPKLRPLVLKTLSAMEQFDVRRFSTETGIGLGRAIAIGWDELNDLSRARKAKANIHNAQFRGKVLGQFVERRLRIDGSKTGEAEAWKLIQKSSKKYAGWALVIMGNHFMQRKEWDKALHAFARAVQCGATHGGELDSHQSATLLAELARAFDLTNEHTLAVKYATAAIAKAKASIGPWMWWDLLNVAERTLALKSTRLGAIALEDATSGAFKGMDDPGRVPLLCFVARVQLLKAGDSKRADEALLRAGEVIRNKITEPLKGTILRCEIAEALYLCGLEDEMSERLSSISWYAERRIAVPTEKADQVIAEAALGHVRCGDPDGAERLLRLIADQRSDSAARASAMIRVYRGDDSGMKVEVSRIRNNSLRSKVLRDIAVLLTKLGRFDQAMTVAREISADRDNALPRIARAFVDAGQKDKFLELLIPSSRFPNATSLILAEFVRLFPESALDVSNALLKFLPDILDSNRRSSTGPRDEDVVVDGPIIATGS